MFRKPLNQLQITTQASSFLAGLAKECKMAINTEQTIPSLKQQIEHTEYMAKIFHIKWQNDHTIAGSIAKHSAYKMVLEHLDELQDKLHEAVVHADYLNQSV